LAGNSSGEELPALALALAQDSSEADLARVIDAWPHLPENVRRAILALAEGGR
jgi:hypothetical protein